MGEAASDRACNACEALRRDGVAVANAHLEREELPWTLGGRGEPPAFLRLPRPAVGTICAPWCAACADSRSNPDLGMRVPIIEVMLMSVPARESRRAPTANRIADSR